MSDDLIRREDAIRTVCEYDCHLGDHPCEEGKGCYAVRGLRKLPSADRPQGRWIDKGDYAICSNCGTHSGTQNDGVEFIPLKTNFCPNCGAGMKGVGND